MSAVAGRSGEHGRIDRLGGTGLHVPLDLSDGRRASLGAGLTKRIAKVVVEPDGRGRDPRVLEAGEGGRHLEDSTRPVEFPGQHLDEREE